MDFASSAEITSVAWEGELIIPPHVYSVTRLGVRPRITLSVPEVWRAAEVLDRPEQAWNPPGRGVRYWLVRMAFIVEEPSGLPAMTEVHHTLQVRARGGAYLFSIFPESLSPRDPTEGAVVLAPTLRFGKTETLGLAALGARIGYRKVFVTVTGTPPGKDTVTWVCKRQAGRGKGRQCLHAVVASPEEADTVQGSVDVAVYLNAQMGRFAFSLPDEGRSAMQFEIGL